MLLIALVLSLISLMSLLESLIPVRSEGVSFLWKVLARLSRTPRL